MIKEFTRFYTVVHLSISCLMGQDTTQLDLSEMDTIGKASVDTELYTNGNGSTNRLPSLLMDVKVLLSEAMIADVHRDTLEVIYYLDRIACECSFFHSFLMGIVVVFPNQNL